MAENARFKIDIYGDTAQFENSLKGINSAMTSLKGEAGQLKRELKLDPTNTNKMQALYKNLQQQMDQTKAKSAKLREEIGKIDRSAPGGEQQFIKLSKQIKDSELQASGLEKQINEVDGALKRGSWDLDVDTGPAEKKVSKLKGLFSGLKQVGIGALRSIGERGLSAVTGSVDGWIDDAKATQKAMIALKNTMEFSGNVKDFDSLSKRMQQVAKDTNANTEDALSLGTTFVGLGNSAKTAGDKVESIIKANQAFGGTGENLKGVVLAYSQMSAAGKVSAENIGQLTDNNTALGAALKTTVMKMNPQLQKFGSFAAASEKGAVTVDMLDKALTKLGKAGGGGVTTIDDAMAALNETISVALLPALDAVTPIITNVIDAISDGVPKAVDWLGKLWESLKSNGAIESFKSAFGNIKSIFGNVIGIVADVVTSFLGIDDGVSSSKTAMEKISEAAKLIGSGLETVTGKISSFLEFLSGSKGKMDVLKSAIVALSGAFVAFKIGSGIATAITTFGKFKEAITAGSTAFKALSAVMAVNPFVLIGVAVAAVVAGLVYFFTQTETGKEMWASFTQFLVDSWNAVLELFSGIGEWFSNLWTGVVTTAQGIWQGFSEFFTGLWTGIADFFSGIWSGITTTIQNAWNTVASFTTVAFNTLVSIFQPIVSVFQSIFNLVVAVFQLGWTVISGVAKVTFNAIVAVWNAIVGVFQTIWSAVSNIVSTVFSAIGSFAQNAWGVVTGIWNGIVNFFSSIFNAVKNVVSTAFSAFGNFAQSAWSAVTGVWNAISNWFSGVFSGVTGIVSGVFNQFGGFAQNAWNAITGVFSGIVGWFSNLFGGVADVVNGVLGGITSTINKITGAINGVTGKAKEFFGGSLVAEMNANVGAGQLQGYSATNAQTYNTNTFNITSTGNASPTDIARAVRREFNLGRA